MLKNYLKIALRNIKNQKIYSFINIIGLAIGMVCTILIFLWVQNELSYDRYHKNKDWICRVLTVHLNDGSVEADTPYILGPTLTNEYPGIIAYARFYNFWGATISVNEKVFQEGRFI